MVRDSVLKYGMEIKLKVKENWNRKWIRLYEMTDFRIANTPEDVALPMANAA